MQRRKGERTEPGTEPGNGRGTRRQRRAGGRQLVLPLGIVLVVALVAWLARGLLGGSPAADAADGAGPGATPRAALPGAGAVATPDAPPEAAATAQPTAAQGSREAELLPREQELAAAEWVEGRVLFPDGTPLDEEVTVIGYGHRFAHGPMHEARTEPDGRFRVAFAKGTRFGSIRIRAHYLWLEDRVPVHPQRLDELVELRPRLGGRIVGQVAREDGVPVALQASDLELDWDWNASDAATWQRASQTKAELAADDRGNTESYAFDGIPPGTYGVGATAKTLFSRPLQGLEVQPGQTTVADLRLVPGTRVEGQVTDDSGAPVEGANLTAQPRDGELPDRFPGQDGGRTARSDATGAFVLEGLAPGDYSILARADGLLPGTAEVQVREAGDPPAPLTIVLERGGHVSGRVVHADGTPAPQARVVVTETDRLSPGVMNVMPQSVPVDTMGSFEAGGMGPGPFTLTAIETQKGGGKEPAGRLVATREDVPSGTQDVVLTLGPGLSIGGVVVDGEGKPVRRCSVVAQRSGGPFFFDLSGSVFVSARVRDEKGAFRLVGLLPGDWTVLAHAAGKVSDEGVTIHVPPERFDLRLRLLEPAIVAGRVVGPDGEPVHRATVRASPVDRLGSGDADQDETNLRGAYRLHVDGSGTYRVFASADGLAPSAPADVQIAPGARVEDLVLALGRGARVEGLVMRADGTPVTGVDVFVSSSGRGDSAKTDGEGAFRFEGVAPGTAVVSCNVPCAIDPSGEVRSQVQIHATRVLADGDVWRPRLAPDSVPRLDTTVTVTRDGEPWSGLTVEASSPERAGWSATGTTEADGTARLVLAGPGTYRFAVHEDALGAFGRGTVVERAVGPDGLVSIAIGTGTVVGRVRQPDGSSVGGSGSLVLELLDADGEPSPWSRTTVRGRTEEDGSFRLERVPAGTYRVRAGGGQRLSSVFARSGDAQQARQDEQHVQVHAGETTDEVDVVLDEGDG